MEENLAPKRRMRSLWRTASVLILCAVVAHIVKYIVVGSMIDTYLGLWISIIAVVLYLLGVVWMVRMFVYLIERQIEREDPPKE